jgi:hypothetical protein
VYCTVGADYCSLSMELRYLEIVVCRLNEYSKYVFVYLYYAANVMIAG